ncbi:MAG TPA: DUF4266 domain-containing protein [Candidatus Polarisedimenticolia bacterium]|nr:DUF4266 domain-containing protein [Candidatus Polarisedimenticolia bacterium]
MNIRSPGLISILLSFLLVCSASAAGPAADGEPLCFSFSDLKGATHTLAEQRGDVVLLEFWASWCVPCRKGVPFLDQLQARYESAGFKILAMTLEEDTDAVTSFVASNPGKFMIGRDPTGHAGEVFEVAAMPTSILLDREGHVLARFEGGSESVHQQIEAAVQSALRGERPVSQPAAKRRRGPKGNLRAWDRGYLADPIMNLDGDTLTRSMREHIHSSKEAAAGDGGVAGGGCGCN